MAFGISRTENTFALCEIIAIGGEWARAREKKNKNINSWCQKKNPRSGASERNAKLMRFILPFQWHQQHFFVYAFVFTAFFSLLFTDIICFLVSKLTASMRKFCMLACASKFDANNPTYLLDLSTFVTIISGFSYRLLLVRNIGIKARMKQRSKQEVREKKESI